MKKLLLIHFLILNLFCTASFAAATIKDEIDETKTFGNVAISTIISRGENGEFAGYKLIVRPITYNKDHIKLFMRGSKKPAHELGLPLWTITGSQLPATEDTCIAANIDSCESNPADPFNVCYHSCIKNGPEFLFYDKRKGDIYITTATDNVGQGGGPMLVYVANIQTKNIRFLRTIGGPINATLSPSGKFLVFYGGDMITIYNLETKEDILIKTENIWTKGKEKLHILSVLRWVNDNQLVYRDNVYHDKFQNEWDKSTEYTYDINAQKNIKRFLINKSQLKMREDIFPY